MLVIEEHVPPVVVSVVTPLPETVDCTLDNPRTIWILSHIIDTGKELLHVILIIFHIFVSF